MQQIVVENIFFYRVLWGGGRDTHLLETKPPCLKSRFTTTGFLGYLQRTLAKYSLRFAKPRQKLVVRLLKMDKKFAKI